jgi:general secretion pathway protein M
MAAPIFERIGLNRLNPREQRLATAFGVLLAVFVLLGIPILVETMIWSRKSENEKTRAALEAVQTARAQVRERQARKDAVASRYQQRAPALAGFLEQTARAQKLEVTDSVDRPEVPSGKKFAERSTVIHLKKAGMYSIAKYLESIEQSGHATSVTRLNIRKRTGEPDSFDVELGVTAYDKKETPVAPDKAKTAGSAEPKK